MNESNRRFASINRIDELNQRIETPKRTKSPQKQPKTPFKTAQKIPKTVQRGPKSPQERPKTPSRRPRSSPRPSQEASWELLGPLGTVLLARSKTRPPRVNRCKLFRSILDPKMPPQTTPKRPQNESKVKTKNASLFYPSWTRLGPVSRRSWADLRGQKAPKPLENILFCEKLPFRKKTTSRRILGPT